MDKERAKIVLKSRRQEKARPTWHVGCTERRMPVANMVRVGSVWK